MAQTLAEPPAPVVGGVKTGDVLSSGAAVSARGRVTQGPRSQVPGAGRSEATFGPHEPRA